MTIANLEELDERLSEPTPGVVKTMGELPGDLLILGVAGKMGPSLARMAKRASLMAGNNRRIVGVARFSDKSAQAELERRGIETIRCDLLDEDEVNRLPAAPNVLYLAGMKFGATGQESLTWAINALVPAHICRKFAESRIVAFSTGNIYGPVSAEGHGSRETDSPAPVGEYAMSCLGRERVFEYFSRKLATPVAIIRLNYACDLRYGVLVDLAQKIQAGLPVDVGMGWFNTIWQGDANAITLNAFAHASSPPTVFNLTGLEKLNVRVVCERLGKLLGKAPRFSGVESPTALLSDARRTFLMLGQLSVTADELLVSVAEWIRAGGVVLNKPTHFESRDGWF